MCERGTKSCVVRHGVRWQPVEVLVTWWMKHLERARQSRCRHVGDLNDLKRNTPDDVECPCWKCGKVLHAPYGAALKLEWKHKPACLPASRD